MIKFTRISVAIMMFAALVLKTLPDSVFDFFHDHRHSDDVVHQHLPGNTCVDDYTYNCHIEDWYYEVYQAEENNFSIVLPKIKTYEKEYVLFFGSISILDIKGRGPPDA